MNSTMQYAALIGLDWADEKHDYVLWDSATGKRRSGQVEQTPEVLAQWVRQLREQFGGRPVAICLEQSRGPLVYALMGRPWLVLYPINPKALARFRETFKTSGAKDDPQDADLLCDLLKGHGDRLRPWKPETAPIRQMTLLCEQRRKQVDARNGFVNELEAALKSCFPQALQWAGPKLSAPMVCDFLSKWSSFEALRRAKVQTVRAFYYAHNCRNERLIQERLEAISQAQPLTTEAAVIEPLAVVIKMLANLIRTLNQAIAELDRQIELLFAQNPDAPLFENLPGAGEALAPRLLCAFGSDRDRYLEAQDLQRLSGIAPVVKRSGKSFQVHWRWHRPKFLCQTFYEFAKCSINQSAWAGAYYRMQIQNGKKAHAAIRALAFKWIRILFRCWQDRTPYDENLYLQSLKKRHSPLLKYLQPQPATL